ncbi:hypothetical protein HY622_02290 [Candidatus Uhrbacteria bacterium]|nr:hypothetical protein [Candidatus Uhrbacteria bacterium]
MQRYWLVAVAFFIILLAVFANRQLPQQGAAPTDQKGAATEESKLEDDSSDEESLKEEESEEAVASNEHIVLLEPAPKTLVPSPFAVRGQARGIPGNMLSVRIVNKDGSAAVSLTAAVRGGDEKTFGTFEIKNLSYTFTNGEEKMLEIFAVGEKGEELYKLVVPLKFTLVE